ncbi:SAM11 protein, partial [Nothocercus nigrocapillus]|nr:SAM11 protein [Nothocercus nigrocapillus]
MSKGILQVHPPICDCPGCRISSPVNRGRLAEKRTIPLPPTRIPKKELTSIFSHSDDSEESDKGNGLHPEVKQEEDLHISIMKRRIHTHWDLNISFRETSCSRDNDLSTIISNLHQSRQLVMPETQSRCEFKRNSIDVGLGAADEILGKRRVCSPNSSSECPLESKKARSESPKENSHTPLLEDAVTQMTPEEHYRRMMSALNEHGTFEEQQQQQQRLYQLANSMAVPGHGDLLRARQEVAAAAARTPGAMEAHIPAASNSSSQRRKQGLPQHRDSHFPEREISHPPPLLSPQNAPHIALGPHLRPPFLGVPSALCQTPGYGFLQPAQAEMFARQQEMLRKQNLARLEMSAELIRQKELENLHRQRLLAGDPLSLHPGLPPDHPALRSRRERLETSPGLQRAALGLRQGEAPAALRAGGCAVTSWVDSPRGLGGIWLLRDLIAPRFPPPALSFGEGEGWSVREAGMHRWLGSCWGQRGKEERVPRRDARGGSEQSEAPGPPPPFAGAAGDGEEGAGSQTGGAFTGTPVRGAPARALDSSRSRRAGPQLVKRSVIHYRSLGASFITGRDSGGLAGDGCCPLSNLASIPEALGAVGPIPFSNAAFSLFLFLQVFREQAIDGETLPLLTEEHLLNNMGLKLGPALKIRSQQVAKRVGRVLYMAGFPMAFPLQPPGLRPPERDLAGAELRPASTGSVASPFSSGLPSASRVSPKQE